MGDRHFSTIHFATTFVFGVGCFGSWQIVSGEIKRNHVLQAKFLHSPATLTFGTPLVASCARLLRCRALMVDIGEQKKLCVLSSC